MQQCWLLVFVLVFFSRVITLALALYIARRVTVMEMLLKSVDSLKKAHWEMSTKFQRLEKEAAVGQKESAQLL